jgi:hypothetical protein
MNNLLSQAVGLDYDEEGNVLPQSKQIQNPTLDPSMSLDQLRDQADAPLFVQPSELQSTEIADISTRSAMPKAPANYMQDAMDEADSQDVMSELEIPSQLANFQGAPVDGLQAPQMPESPLSRRERLFQEYMNLQKNSQKELEDARSRDRMLKVGGSIGDALATYLNAQSQMNVKAPGVQVQQGAGLGKVADMFQTAPDKASDMKQRREDLLAQYKALAEGDARALQERKIAAYEKQVEGRDKLQKEKPTVGEQTIDREFAKKYNEWATAGKADYEENAQILKDAINDLETGKVSTGSVSGVTSRIPGVRTDTRELETRVRKAVNGMLRATLGAQFTEEEGKRIFEQTFDPFASPEENVKNMQTELAKIEKRKNLIEQQGEVFKQRKTLSGYEAPETMPTSVSKVKEVRQGDNIFDANTGKFLRKAQ